MKTQLLYFQCKPILLLSRLLLLTFCLESSLYSSKRKLDIIIIVSCHLKSWLLSSLQLIAIQAYSCWLQMQISNTPFSSLFWFKTSFRTIQSNGTWQLHQRLWEQWRLQPSHLIFSSWLPIPSSLFRGWMTEDGVTFTVSSKPRESLLTSTLISTLVQMLLFTLGMPISWIRSSFASPMV